MADEEKIFKIIKNYKNGPKINQLDLETGGEVFESILTVTSGSHIIL